MKHRLPGLLLASCLLASHLLAAEETPLLATLEVFALPAETASTLIGRNLTGAELRQHAITAVKGKTATLDTLMLVRLITGTRVAVEQTEHYLYPTEFDPPQVPQILGLIDPCAKDKPVSTPSAQSTQRSPFNGGLGTLSTTTPTAFEMRPLGETLILDPNADNEAGTLIYDYEFTSTRLLSVETTHDIPRPVFSTRKLQGKATLAPNVPALLGTFNPARRTGVRNESKDDHTSLAFLTLRGELAASKRSPGKQPNDPFAGNPEVAEPTQAGNLRLTLEAIALDLATAHSVLSEPLDDTALHTRLFDLIKTHQATRETMLAVRTQSGQRTDSGNQEEFIYPSEFDPPQLPGTLIIADHGLIDDLRAGRQSGLGPQPPMEGGNPNGGFGLITSVSSTAFQMQPLGELLEIDPVVHDRFIDTHLAATVSRIAGTVRYVSIDHPIFETRRLTTRVRGELGHPILIGTLSKATHTGFTNTAPDDRLWLAFLHATAP